LLRFDVTQDHFKILLVLGVARSKIHVAFMAMLGDTVAFCFVSHNLSFILASVIAHLE